MIKLGRNKPNIGRSVLSTTEVVTIDQAFAWDVGFYHKSGGLKKDLYIFGSTDCPIKSIQFELNKRIMGAGVMNLSFVDFPIHADDFVILTYKGTTAYRGLIDHAPDPKQGKLKLVPYSRRYKELLINKTYTTQTASAMLQDIVEDLQSDTGITWNSDLVSTGESTTYTKVFEYVTAEKAVKEIVGELSDREWGVNVNNVFTVYTPNTTVDEMFFQSYEPIFTSVEAKYNWNKIKATRYQVLRKPRREKQRGKAKLDTGGATRPLD
jgi:hypothetical protein